MTHDRPFEKLQTPIVVAVVALSFFGLAANAQPDTLVTFGGLVLHNPIPSAVVTALIGGLCITASRLPDARALLARRVTLGLIAVSLLVIVGDALGLVRADVWPWALIVVISTPLILLGGLTNLIVATRRPLG